MRQASLLPVVKKWTLDALKKTPRSTSARSDSTPGNHSADHVRHRQREDLSTVRGAFKRNSFAVTLDSDSSWPPFRIPSRRGDRKQVLNRIYHASERDDSDSPQFPRRITRSRAHVLSLPTPFEPAISTTGLTIEVITARPSPLFSATCPPLASICDRLTPSVMLGLPPPCPAIIAPQNAPHTFRPGYVGFCRPCECFIALCTQWRLPLCGPRERYTAPFASYRLHPVGAVSVPPPLADNSFPPLWPP